MGACQALRVSIPSLVAFFTCQLLASASNYNDAVLSKNPLLYWTFDEPGSTDNAASLVNAAAENELSAQGNASRIASNIGLGNAASFSSGGHFYAADLFGPSVLAVPSQLWAVELWFNPASSGPQYISESRRASSNDPAMIYGYNLGSGDDPAFGFYNSSGNQDAGPLAAGQWHHVVVAFYGNNSGFHDNLREIYVNGVLTVSDAVTGFSSGHSLEQFSIGATVAGGDPFSGLVDEYAIYDIGTNYPDLDARRTAVQSIAQHFELVTGTENPPVLELIINRDDGSLTIVNNTGGGIGIKGYSITSSTGALNIANWKSVAEYYDVDGPNGGALLIGSVDHDDAWTILTDTLDPTNADLREFEFNGDGGFLAPSGTINLGEKVWFRFPVEDIAFEYANENGDTVPGLVTFIGNDDVAFIRSDLNFDGILSIADWTEFIGNMSTDLTGMSVAEAYQWGDLNGDGNNDLFDLQIFKADYDAEHGPGAFAAMVAIPEPAAVSMLLFGVIGLFMRCRFDARAFQLKDCFASMKTPILFIFGAGIVGVLFSVQTARADLYGLFRFEDGGVNTTLDVGQTLLDSSGRENDGSVFAGTVDLVPGQAGFGNAAYFANGMGSAVLSGIGNTVNDFSVAFWIKVVSTPGTLTESYVTARNATVSPQTQLSVIYDYADDTVEFFSDDSPNPRPGTQISLLDGNWHHIVYTRTGADYGAYVNGVKSDIGTLSGAYLNVPELIGIGGSPTGGGIHFFDGYLDDVAWFNNGLNQAQVNKIIEGDFSDFTSLLTIDVFTASGQTFLRNRTSVPITFDGYAIRSDGDSLNPAGWTSLDDQGVDAIGGGAGQSWDKGGGSSSGEISEGYLLGSTTLAPGQSLNLGFAYAAAIDAQDLLFRFSTLNTVLRGEVNYVNDILPGDFNFDGGIDGADFLMWQRTIGDSVAPYSSSDANGDGIVNGDDLIVWKAHFGQIYSGIAVTANQTPTPEPASVAMLIILAISSSLFARNVRLASRRERLAFRQMSNSRLNKL